MAPEMLIFLLIALTSLALVLYFPIYLYKFSRHRRLAKKLNLLHKPSIITALLYVIISVWLVLTFIYYPTYLVETLYCHRLKLEAHRNLKEIYNLQRAYFSEYDTYSGGQRAFRQISWTPEGWTDFKYYLDGEQIPNDGGPPIEFSPNKCWPFTVRPDSSKKNFTALAVGNIDSDECPQAWVINDAGKLTDIVIDFKNTSIEGMCQDLVGIRIWSGLKPIYILVQTSVINIILIPFLLWMLIRDRKKYLTLKEMSQEQAEQE